MKIGLTYTGSDVKHENYVRWLKDQDDTIEVIRLSVTEDLDVVKNCDALVLSGGVDIEPTLYGGGFGYEKAPKDWQKDRDLFESSVLQFAWEHGLPVMGVCRGLQLINVNCQGTLVQDLGLRGDEVHENVTGIDKRHPVEILEGTLLASVTRQERGEANSAHHQAIDRVGKGLRVNCRAEDGTIEGIEWADPAGKPFMIAVQWHPERMYTNGYSDALLYKGIRDRFIEAIKEAVMGVRK
jgi:putative glutamine amidotransferase